MCIVLLAPGHALIAATDDEVAELKSMVLALMEEVQALKIQMAENEATRDFAVPLKSEKDTELRAPVTKPAVASVSSKYGLSFYGYFKLDALYDSDLTSHQEIPFWVRPNRSINKGSFDMTGKETRLGMNFAGPEVLGGKVTGKLEMDFYGNINTPASLSGNHAYRSRTRHAYTNWDFGDWSILAGQTWEPYIIAFPQTLNFSYYNFMGQLGLRKTQLRITKKIGDDLELTGAILEPVGAVHGGDLDGDLQDDATDSDIPVFSGKILYKTHLLTEKTTTLGLSFVYGREKLDLPVERAKTYESWAVSGAFTLPLTDKIIWKTSMFMGSNLDSFWGGIGQGINTTLGREIDGVGGWSQLQFNPTDKVSINIGYSVDDPDDDDLSFGARSKNESYLANFYYSFSPSLIWGIEYFKGETAYKGQGTSSNNHFQSSLIYKF